MLHTKNYVEKTKSAIALTKIFLKICNFELALNNSVIMLRNKYYVDRPKTKSAIALTKIG